MQETQKRLNIKNTKIIKGMKFKEIFIYGNQQKYRLSEYLLQSSYQMQVYNSEYYRNVISCKNVAYLPICWYFSHAMSVQ